MAQKVGLRPRLKVRAAKALWRDRLGSGSGSGFGLTLGWWMIMKTAKTAVPQHAKAACSHLRSRTYTRMQHQSMELSRALLPMRLRPAAYSPEWLPDLK